MRHLSQVAVPNCFTNIGALVRKPRPYFIYWELGTSIAAKGSKGSKSPLWFAECERKPLAVKALWSTHKNTNSTKPSPLPKTYDQSPNSLQTKSNTSFWKEALGYASTLNPCDSMVKVAGTSFSCPTETPFKRRIWISGIKIRDGKAARGLQRLKPRLRLISILFNQGPVGCLGTAQEHLRSFRKWAWVAEECTICGLTF